MASPELASAEDSSTRNPNSGKEDGSVSGTKKTCPVHAPAGEEAKRSFRKGIARHNDYVKISVPESKVSRLPTEWWKTAIAFFYAAFNLVLTTVVITVVHERVPPKESSPPLPDKFFDYIDRVKWAFTVTEVNGMVLVAIWLVQLFFFKYKSIACRRFFFLIGTLYLYRCVTMYVTTLPVPGMHMNCAPKLQGDTQAKIQRILQLISGAGLSINNSHLLCGDFLYSGHTVMLTLTYLFIKEYSPKSFWWYHLVCWLLSAVGVLCILVAHEHYTVDVVVAYFITSRLFWWYHTMANLQILKCSPNNYLTNTWWNPLFNFFERNVQTSVPCSYSWPITWASACLKNPCKKYSMVQSSREE
ncbi:phosphatidylcholine:ceramide cholinephosphotransferase 2 [Fundulus heteroclitus]|uniref:phosphatidylcholine:ceramide cholinephosphotransferase 2 n=1 Tax=Fundulus heteroclitus TaxID=8078 RepID=UPI00165BE7E5|nr:phosphatidylcholine:ceramide cholinephosphotransferase 2 [Fundulus heteroclitus]XP_035993487.1 phosphatidylcholine:ceramide cholinephosphotransferase 2 [Fundulus heteroclitus]